MSEQPPITASIPLITQSTILVLIHILPNETAGHPVRRLGVYHLSAFFQWPLRVRTLAQEHIYQSVKRQN